MGNRSARRPGLGLCRRVASCIHYMKREEAYCALHSSERFELSTCTQTVEFLRVIRGIFTFIDVGFCWIMLSRADDISKLSTDLPAPLDQGIWYE